MFAPHCIILSRTHHPESFASFSDALQYYCQVTRRYFSF